MLQDRHPDRQISCAFVAKPAILIVFSEAQDRQDGMLPTPSAMEPLSPISGPVDEQLYERSNELLRASGQLGSGLPPEVKSALTQRVRAMNSYYSNFIEGRFTHPTDIERALKNDYSTEPSKAELQFEARAHIEVQVRLEERLAQESALQICSAGFLRWIHKTFYEAMPPNLRFARTDAEGILRDSTGHPVPIDPGGLRTRNVRVGRHIPPPQEVLGAFLNRFQEAYEPNRVPAYVRIASAFAAHHRLTWIHPFMDGNGRVTRLFLEAYLVRAGVGGIPLWTMSRGLARRRDAYMEALTWADSPRRGDLDGRGALSLEGLQRFCLFMFEVALDQVEFMAKLVNDRNALVRRLSAYVDRRSAEGSLRLEAKHMLVQALMMGSLQRGEAVRVSGLGERVGRDLLGDLLREGLLVSRTPKGPVSLGFPARVLPYYLPDLYPTPIEEDLRRLPPPEPTEE